MTNPAVFARKVIEEELNDRAQKAEAFKLQDTCPAGLFVSIHTKAGELRGCIGTVDADGRSLSELIREYALCAAFKDPRFPPVTKEELPGLEFKVDVLSKPEPVRTEKELDPKKYGIVIKGSMGRKGVLLPDIEGVDTIEQQVGIACRKAGILPGEPYKIYKFEVKRYEEGSASGEKEE